MVEKGKISAQKKRRAVFPPQQPLWPYPCQIKQSSLTRGKCTYSTHHAPANSKNAIGTNAAHKHRSSTFTHPSHSKTPTMAPPLPRWRPIASISSMKSMEGDWLRAWANRSLWHKGRGQHTHTHTHTRDKTDEI
eukprot:1162020-Pelagomonas_calceolata.AAC.21